ncbi:ABC transporter substrate-binding protein [Streptomyces melanosporofaciens]|uniref:ABC-type branched-chain amino acid transport system, substrate-binding protein n=1 Tax=Streptomyces melanosporofaciens TaxID=67327 RepID=A0A1H4Y023_STRMJ|nr:branched-chain amino acid ABC transporter substrate-binding protein [Streptomyces melanosporofaciens]SED11167.1 ABC-type branched-chain amino acid transport system, substrate-binding protein [Streptomyces melanosporofaciens]
MPRLEWPLHIVRRVVIGVLVVALLAVAVPLTWKWIEEKRARCGDGVVEKGDDHECVGVTDGSYVFADHLKSVEKKIKAENDRVEENTGKEPYVSVAYMTSFTLTDDDSNSEESVRHELEGAYLAQYRHNRGDLSSSPKIKLLIANVGSSAAHWEHTVDELIDRMTSDRDKLVAVTGLGPSTDRSLSALRRLSDRGLALVASTMTATNIEGIKGFVRVSPTNVDEAYAASAYLKKQKVRTAVVVQDAARSNYYAKTLGDAFTEVFQDTKGHRLVADRMTYDSSVRSAWENELRYMPGQLCDQKPEVVYFAGRGKHLTRFLDSLANRPCQERKFTVITGDDTSNLTAKELAHAADSGVRVLYTGLAHPDMWRQDPLHVSGPSAGHFQPGGSMDKWFPGDPRYDGQAIMGHDAVLAAAHGIQMAAGWQGEVSGDAVARMFHQMDGRQQVAGASGFISFQNNGNPRNKAIPILHLNARGRSELVEVSAPRGEPPRKQ